MRPAIRSCALLLAVAMLAGCAGATPASHNPGPASLAPATEAPAQSAFRRALSDAGIAFAPPEAGKAILVNVPAFELIAFDDGEPAFRSRVIVGTPWNPTPLLSTRTTVVRFRPSWRPTPAMVASGEYPDRIVPPGPNNPLGLAAVRMEPGLLVYMHDTNRRELFAEDARALSHGCIRVQRWDELIAWLLDTDLATVHGWAEGGRTFDEPTPPVPVTIGYFTQFPADDGTLQVFADVYGRELAGEVSQVAVTAGCTG
ncbi:MAG: L,D-transpeptidase family protein [Alphaproteobacteria bacterium]